MSQLGDAVQVRLPFTAGEVEWYFGERCPDYDEECCSCIAWAEHDNGGWVTVEFTVTELKKLMRETTK